MVQLVLMRKKQFRKRVLVKDSVCYFIFRISCRTFAYCFGRRTWQGCCFSLFFALLHCGQQLGMYTCIFLRKVGGLDVDAFFEELDSLKVDDN